MFGAALDAGRVRLLAVPLWNRAFVAGPALVVWPARWVSNDFSRAALRLQAIFVHELTHVWQAQNGVGLLRAKLRAGDSAASYAYEAAGLADFSALNIEQQAMAVEHAFLASRGAATPFAAKAYAGVSQILRQA